jgi:16S rRNA (guanine966-N2)-methyltransferase
VRIIAGEFRGRRLLPPDTDVTRPITDRVKQSLFDIVTPVLEDAVVYDCFAGTGSMGLESLSRGAKSATFFEMDRSAIKRLTANIATLGVQSRSTILPGDVFKRAMDRRPTAKASLVFLDPPYRLLREMPMQLVGLAREFAEHHLTPDALLVFRHDVADSLALPPFSTRDVRTYGGMALEFMQADIETVSP